MFGLIATSQVSVSEVHPVLPHRGWTQPPKAADEVDIGHSFTVSFGPTKPAPARVEQAGPFDPVDRPWWSRVRSVTVET